MNNPNSAVIVDTSHSPHARLRPATIQKIQITDSFWAPRLRLNREVSLPAQFKLLKETGRLDNFRRAAGKIQGDFKGYVFNDSDVYKWLEAAAWALAAGPDLQLERMSEAAIAEIIAAQDADGYLNTHFTFARAKDRWTNLRDLHELYCAGHLFQAAVAWARVSDCGLISDQAQRSSQELLGAACRQADHICAVFAPDQRPAAPGHPEVEMALIELARQTGKRQYLEQAQAFIDQRGRGLIGGSAYHLDHLPYRDLPRLAGHAVRALYLSAGAADLYAETGDPNMLSAMQRVWQNMVSRQLYIHGGLGARHDGEAFGGDYELPNERAYAETCAAIASLMWNWRMLQLNGEARYADLLELALYNGFLSGLALDGLGYFYENPLSSDGSQRRQPWFPCACCPPNVARTLAALPGYFYSTSDEGIWVHLYAQGQAELKTPGGGSVLLEQETRYPRDGQVKIRLAKVDGGGNFSLYLRIPGWVQEGQGSLIAHSQKIGKVEPGTYVQIHGPWQTEDEINLHLPMPVRQLSSHPYVLENAGRAALMRGPILYCLEAADLPEGSQVDLRDISIQQPARISEKFQPDLLGGVVILQFPGFAGSTAGWGGQLYSDLNPQEAVSIPLTLQAIPYYAWANRAPGQMQVWLKI